MKKLLGLLMVLSFVLTLVPAAAFAHNALDPFVTDLIAGGGNPKSATDVGEVEVWNDGDYLYVKYVVDAEDWSMTKTHLAVATDLDDIPQKKGNPIPGRFEYSDTEDTYRIPLEWDVDTELYIAAPANVQKLIGYDCPTLDDIAAALPEQVTIHTQNYPNPDSYFDVLLNGETYGVWCIDEGHTIHINRNYTVNVYSSYEPLPDSLTTGTDPNIDHPENLDLVNWVMNNSDGYNSTEVQNVIWALIDDASTRADLTGHEQELYDAAIANGEGFEPGMGDVVGIILQPVDPNANAQVTVAQVTIAQVTLLQLGLECTPIYQTGTAWGEGDEGEDFPGKNWAMYFTYTVQE